jgi:hypothetical protein
MALPIAAALAPTPIFRNSLEYLRTLCAGKMLGAKARRKIQAKWILRRM